MSSWFLSLRMGARFSCCPEFRSLFCGVISVTHVRSFKYRNLPRAGMRTPGHCRGGLRFGRDRPADFLTRLRGRSVGQAARQWRP